MQVVAQSPQHFAPVYVTSPADLDAAKQQFNFMLDKLLNTLVVISDRHEEITRKLTQFSMARMTSLTDHMPHVQLYEKIKDYRKIVLKLNAVPMAKRNELLYQACQVWPLMVSLAEIFSEELRNYQSVIQKIGNMPIDQRVQTMNELWALIILLCDLAYKLNEPMNFQKETDTRHAIEYLQRNHITPTEPLVVKLLSTIQR